MTTTPDRPALDDPRVLALARARQQVAHEGTYLPTWDELTEQERTGSLPDARNYLHAAIKAGLVPTALPPVSRAAVLLEAANALACVGPEPLASGPKAWDEAVTVLRRLAAEEQPACELIATTCSAQLHNLGEPYRLCIRAAHHAGLSHTDENGMHWSETVAVYPLADGTLRQSPGIAEMRRMLAAAPAAAAAPAGTEEQR